jgi:hypothetical protein
MLDKLAELNEENYNTKFGDPEIHAKVQQYEMAYRMQTAVPEIMDLTKEPDDIVKLYGPNAWCPAPMPPIACWRVSLSESGVRFIQLYHQGWDQHDNLPGQIKGPGKRCGPGFGSPDYRPEATRPAR